MLTLLGIQFSNVTCLELLLCQLRFLLDTLLVAFGKADESLQFLLVAFALLLEVIHLKSFRPHMLVEVHQHVFLKPRLPIVDADTVVMPIQTVNQRLDRRVVQVSKIGRALTRLLTHHEGLRVDQSERIDHDLAFDGLYRIDDDGNSPWGELFEGLLSVDIHR